MILVLGRPALGSNFTNAVSESTGHRTELVHSIRTTLDQLRKHHFTLLIIDDGLPELDDSNTKLLLAQAGTALPVFVNLAVSLPDRVSREARVAILSVQAEEQAAQQIAHHYIGAQIRSGLASVILASEQMSRSQTDATLQDHLKRVTAAAMRILTELKNTVVE